MPTPNATELDSRFSGGDAKPTPWTDAQRALTDARIYWLTTARHDLRPIFQRSIAPRRNHPFG